MTPYYEDTTTTVWHGDCIEVMRSMPDASVDAVVTDPPYGLEFMGKEWDKFDRKGPASFENLGPTLGRERTATAHGGGRSPVEDKPRFSTMGPLAMLAFQQWCQAWATEARRVIKPGGHLLAFGGTRTSHRLVTGIEDAGFEIRDSIVWLYGSGFPKSLDVSKAIDTKLWRDWLAAHPEEAARLDAIEDDDEHDAAELDLRRRAGFERETIGVNESSARRNPNGKTGTMRLHGFTTVTELETAAANGGKCPDGRDAAITLARLRATVTAVSSVTTPATDAAQQWDGWGTALKPAHEPIVVARKPLAGTAAANVLAHGTGALNIDACRIEGEAVAAHRGPANPRTAMGDGWGNGYQSGDAAVTPLSTAGRWPANVILDEAAAALLDQQSGDRPPSTRTAKGGECLKPGQLDGHLRGIGGQIGDSWGYEDTGGASRFFKVVEPDRFLYTAKAPSSERVRADGVNHPTVKPLDLMRWLVKLVTPPGGLILDPFAGSGTTGEAAILEGFRAVLIEQDPTYLPLIEARVTRQRDPIRHLQITGGDLGLFDLED